MYTYTHIHIYTYVHIYYTYIGTEHLSGSQKFGKSRNLTTFENIYVAQYRYSNPVLVFYTCTGVLWHFLYRSIKVRQTLIYNDNNLYPLKTVLFFTFHSLFHHLSTRKLAQLWSQASQINGVAPVEKKLSNRALPQNDHSPVSIILWDTQTYIYTVKPLWSRTSTDQPLTYIVGFIWLPNDCQYDTIVMTFEFRKSSTTLIRPFKVASNVSRFREVLLYSKERFYCTVKPLHIDRWRDRH